MLKLLQLLLLRLTVSWQLPTSTPPVGSLLVISPHPDDEAIGCGGIFLSALEAGKPVYFLYLTDGEGSGADSDPALIRMQRKHLTESVQHSLDSKFYQVYRFLLPDGAVPRRGETGFNEVANRLVELIETLRPDNVLATHAMDYWPYDHVACAELAEASVVRSKQRPKLWFYWVWAWHNLRPWRLQLSKHPGLRRINITRWAPAKRRMLDLYLNPRSPSGVPWSGRLPMGLRLAARFKIEVVEQKDFS